MYSCPFNLAREGRRALWELTYRCNLLCKHCFIFDNAAIPQREEMGPKEYKKIITLLPGLGINEVWLSGGEPLLNRYVFDIIDLLHQNGIKVSISSNGVLINRNTLERIRGKIGYIHVSIDGKDAETHDKIRGVPGSFEKMVNAVKLLTSAGIKVGASCVVSKYNIGQYQELADFAFNLGISVMSFYPAIDLGRGKQEILPSATLEKISKELNAISADYNGKMKIEVFRLFDGKPLDPCRADKFITITPYGAIGPCPWLCKSRNDLFIDPFDESSKNIIERITASVIRINDSRVAAMGKCTSCELNSSCGKGCPAITEQYDTLCVKNYDSN